MLCDEASSQRPGGVRARSDRQREREACASYNPDWAVLIEQDGEERLYFVVETKGSLFTEDLRVIEEAKIQYGRAHFEALAVGESPARYEVTRTLAQLLARL